MKLTSNGITKFLLTIYLIGIYWIIILKLNVPHIVEKRSVNFIPFAAPMVLNGKVDYGEMVLNVLIFIPLGIYTATLKKHLKIHSPILLVMFTSCLLEFLQFMMKVGAADITDVMTNTFGGLIGVLVYELLLRIFKNHTKVQQIVNILAITFTLLFIGFIVYLKVNHLWMFRERTLFR